MLKHYSRLLRMLKILEEIVQKKVFMIMSKMILSRCIKNNINKMHRYNNQLKTLITRM